MKLGEVIPKYREYRQVLVDRTRSLAKQRDEAKKQYELTGDKKFEEEAATLQLSVEASDEEFKKNQKVLDGLIEQYTAAWILEVARQQSDPETCYAATMGKIMTTAMRMCRGDNVPYTDEKKLQEANEKLYAAAKQAQAMMKQMKDHKSRDYDSLWDEEGGEYDPEAAAENAEAVGELPEIPETETDTGVEV
ncbi:MAG: hypothetical protein J5626_10420 [Lachnospiraceae bacterium]|nr:hypothetical protein [Lachnospiraceae bacterium]